MNRSAPTSLHLSELIDGLAQLNVPWAEIKRTCLTGKLTKKTPPSLFFIVRFLRLQQFNGDPFLFAVANQNQPLFNGILKSIYGNDVIWEQDSLNAASCSKDDHYFDSIFNMICQKQPFSDTQKKVLFETYQFMCQKMHRICFNPYWKRTLQLIDIFPNMQHYKTKSGKTFLNEAIKLNLDILASYLIKEKECSPLESINNSKTSVYEYVYKKSLLAKKPLETYDYYILTKIMRSAISESNKSAIENIESRVNKAYQNRLPHSIEKIFHLNNLLSHQNSRAE